MSNRELKCELCGGKFTLTQPMYVLSLERFDMASARQLSFSTPTCYFHIKCLRDQTSDDFEIESFRKRNSW